MGLPREDRNPALALTLSPSTGQQDPVTQCVVRPLPRPLTGTQFWVLGSGLGARRKRKCVHVRPHTGCWEGPLPFPPLGQTIP